ncbi:type II toxin-antitoxin system VapB family antitoxin [Streptomyces sp. NPDC001251]|uniref:type II toxin-antitoxin system VapB family antitoxin n=1 Tax=Streptomyces sp. CB01201 TaxID=2020324 RepID=UPI000C27321A|nr:type II toxin-antitoxin system VapB family antitoxin [Streptomyces sp. CB01201]PJM99350.1 DUF2191 domain-containing protein [Streptomyces sp. CB01201]
MSATRIAIDDEALAEAMRLSGIRAQSEMVNLALREYAARRRRGTGATCASGVCTPPRRTSPEHARHPGPDRRPAVSTGPPLGEVAAADLLPGIREHNVTHAPR